MSQMECQHVWMLLLRGEHDMAVWEEFYCQHDPTHRLRLRNGFWYSQRPYRTPATVSWTLTSGGNQH